MTDLLTELQDHVLCITLNRVSKRNAFDDTLLTALYDSLEKAAVNALVHVILLKANGSDFSAGADLNWMQRMVHYTEAENSADALILARLMHTLHHHPKPTIAMVQGAAIGGGAGLVAACDIAIAADTARFRFSEVTLGLIPAVISPYVIKAMGERVALNLFLSAETFDAQRAYHLNLIHHCVPEDTLLSFTIDYAKQLANLPPLALIATKSLVHQVANRPITDDLIQQTARLIAKQRISPEAQHGLKTFLGKKG